MRKTLFFSLALVVGVILGLGVAVKLNLFSPAQSENPVSPATTVSSEETKIEDAVIQVANTTGKAVVSISTEATTRIKGAKRFYFGQPFGGQFPEQDELFRRFFDEFFGEIPETEFKQRGLGSGVIINPEGYILTNEHVIGNAQKITVTLPDGREFKGTVKGTDPRSDLAIVKIEAHNLPVAVLGDSDSLKIGQWVVAIGNPFGYVMQNPEPTVTAGVVSALHRSLGKVLARERDYNDLIQTDAAINPGNSGGPLTNLKGEVVGINVAIFSTTGGYQGIGFAIPINNAKRIISSLIEGKKIAYGWLGVSVQNLTEDLARHFGLADKNGVLVAKVLEDSPAQKAGIKEGDVIKQFDYQTINSVRELLNVVGRTQVGRKVKVLVTRDKKDLILEVVVGERPQDLEETGLTRKPVGKWRGLKVEALTPANASRYAIEEKRGVVVTEVEMDSPASEAGIMPGDLILEINKKPINNLSDYNNAIKDLKDDALVRTSRGYFLIKPD